MKVLFFGDMAGTGFGTVTMDLGRAMLDRGVDLRFVSLNTIAQLPEPFASRTIQLGPEDGWISTFDTKEEAVAQQERIHGLLSGASHPDGWTPDAAIVLGDVVAVRNFIAHLPESVFRDDFPFFHYVPIEGVGLPPSWRELWRHLRPVAMCRFGVEQIATIMGEQPPFVYHGVDTSVFYQVSPLRPIKLTTVKGPIVLQSKRDCRRFLAGGLMDDPGDRLWLFRSDRLMPRKRFASMFRAIAPVLAAESKVDLVLHCRTEDEGGNIDDEVSKLHPSIRRQVVKTGFHDVLGGVNRDLLNVLYNAADIYISTGAEGFGLTVAEAIACGVPAVGMDFSSVPEVIGPAGITVPLGFLVDNEYDYWWANVDEAKYTEAVLRLVRSVGLRRDLGNAGPEHVRTHFSWAAAAEQFEALIEGALVKEAVAA